MNELISFAKSFIFCSFAVLFIHIIAPKGCTEKIVSLVLTAFTLLSVVGPVKKIKNIIPDNSNYISEFEEEENNNDSYSAINTEIRLLTDEALNSIDIDNYELIIDTHTSEETVVIEEYKIYVDDISRKDEISDAVKAKTGLDPEILEMDES